jgi:hypothetical protein
MATTMYPSDSQHARVYMQLRRLVGWIGILLPIVLVAGNALIFGGDRILPSISHYYHSDMRDVLVGGLCAMGMFLFYYSGYDAWEDWAGNAAGVFALGVALFPTVERGPLGTTGIIHYVSAIALFLTVATYPLFLFSRNRPYASGRRFAWIHRVCGMVLVASVLGIAVFFLFFRGEHPDSHVPLGLETASLWAFGLSWLVEGRELTSAT